MAWLMVANLTDFANLVCFTDPADRSDLENF
jgi:hypothetical protein